MERKVSVDVDGSSGRCGTGLQLFAGLTGTSSPITRRRLHWEEAPTIRVQGLKALNLRDLLIVSSQWMNQVAICAPELKRSQGHVGSADNRDLRLHHNTSHQ